MGIIKTVKRMLSLWSVIAFMLIIYAMAYDDVVKLRAVFFIQIFMVIVITYIFTDEIITLEELNENQSVSYVPVEIGDKDEDKGFDTESDRKRV